MPRYTAADAPAIRAQVEILHNQMARYSRRITHAAKMGDDEAVENNLAAYLAAHSEAEVLRKAQKGMRR